MARASAGPGAELGVDEHLLDVLVPLEIPGSWFAEIPEPRVVRMDLLGYDRLEEPPSVQIDVDTINDDPMWHLRSSDVAIGEVVGDDHVERRTTDDPYPVLAGHGHIVNARTENAARQAIERVGDLLVEEAEERSVRALLVDERGDLPPGIGEMVIQRLARTFTDPEEVRIASEAYLKTIDGIGAAAANRIVDAVQEGSA